MHILLLIDITKPEDWGAGWLAGSLSANTGSILQAETCELPSLADIPSWKRVWQKGGDTVHVHTMIAHKNMFRCSK